MEYLYAILLLHAANTPITEDNITKVLKTADVEPDTERIKKLVASVKDIDIDDTIQNPFIAQAPTPVTHSTEVTPTEPEPEEDEETSQEQAFKGLDVLFRNQETNND